MLFQMLLIVSTSRPLPSCLPLTSTSCRKTTGRPTKPSPTAGRSLGTWRSRNCGNWRSRNYSNWRSRNDSNWKYRNCSNWLSRKKINWKSRNCSNWRYINSSDWRSRNCSDERSRLENAALWLIDLSDCENLHLSSYATLEGF